MAWLMCAGGQDGTWDDEMEQNEPLNVLNVWRPCHTTANPQFKRLRRRVWIGSLARWVWCELTIAKVGKYAVNFTVRWIRLAPVHERYQLCRQKRRGVGPRANG